MIKRRRKKKPKRRSFKTLPIIAQALILDKLHQLPTRLIKFLILLMPNKRLLRLRLTI